MYIYRVFLNDDDQFYIVLYKQNFMFHSVQTLVTGPVITMYTCTHVVTDTIQSVWISKLPTILRVTRSALTPNLLLALTIVLIKL